MYSKATQFAYNIHSSCLKNAVKVEFNGIPKSHHNEKPVAGWNLGKPNGWKIYEDESNKVAEKIEDIIDEDNVDINTIMKKIDVID